MDTKKFTLLLSCLTALACVLTIIYNFASMPPYSADSVSAVPLFASQVESADASQPPADSSADSGTVPQPPASSSAPASSAQQSAPASSPASSAPQKTSSSTKTSQSSAVSHAATTKASSSTVTPQNPVNINTANLAQLETIPYIGAVKAQAILDYRSAHGTFTSVDELDNVKGIGAKTIDKIRSYIKLN